MKHSGKLPAAVAGEIQHELNSQLGAVILQAEMIGGVEAEKIKAVAYKMADYVKSLGEKSEWNSNPFEDTYKKDAA
jgi:hypothetical protein